VQNWQAQGNPFSCHQRKQAAIAAAEKTVLWILGV